MSKQRENGKLICKAMGDRRYLYLKCRDAILSHKYPERNKTLFPKENNKTKRTNSNSPHTPSLSLASSPYLMSPMNFPSGRKLETVRSTFKRNPSTPNVKIKSPSTKSPSIMAPKNEKESEDEQQEAKTLTEYYQFQGMHYVFTHHKRAVTRIKFGRQSRELLAFSSVDKSITVSNLSDTPPSVTDLKGHNQGVTDFDWSMTNDFLLSSSLDHTMKVWNIKTNTCIRSIDLSTEIFTCCFHPINNNVIVAGTSSGSVEFYNFSTGIQLCSISLDSAAKSLTFSNDGMILFAGCADGKIRWLRCTNPGFYTIFRIEGNAAAASQGRAINCITYREYHSPQQNIPSLLVNVVDSTVRLFKFNAKGRSDKEILQAWIISPVVNISYTVHSSFCPLVTRSEACFVSGSEDSAVYIYSYPSNHNPVKGLANPKNLNELRGHTAAVLDVSWNFDESYLASGDSDGAVIVWKRVKKLMSNN